jgi:hypothetical protein
MKNRKLSYWYKEFASERFDKAKMKRAIKNFTQKSVGTVFSGVCRIEG